MTTPPAGGDSGRPSAVATVLFLVALFAAALSLRPQLTAVGPLLPRIQSDLEVPYSVVGLLATIPVVCMGLFSPIAPAVAGWLGPRRAATVSVFVIGIFGVLRAFAPGVASLLVTTAVIGIAVGIGGALLPVAVKNRLPDRPLLGSGVYVAGIQLGAALAAFVAVPLAVRFDGWSGSLGILSAITIGLGCVWWLLRLGAVEGRERVPIPRLPVGSGLAWLLAFTLGLVSANYHAFTAWLPAYLVESGWDASPAGSALASASVAALVATLLLPVIAERRGSRRSYLVPASSLLSAALVGLLIAPGAGWVFVPMVGFAQGVLFLTMLVIPLDVATKPGAVGAIAGLMLGAGYLMAAPAPSILGAVRDATGSFQAPMLLLVAMGFGTVVLSALLSAPRLARGVSVSERAPRG